ncbi:unnamed protein product [Owenia fusiformis]|uniref:ZAD domain-containing protein n=1 Tax=Owenia fusiformis TaxID=6347 RepID=A0A8S4N7B2_OWEFU|nr:unnamed protein product [Owenia fusiformis]
MDHLESHKKALNALCRLCASKTTFSKRKVKKRPCILIQLELLKYSEINLDNDNPDLHPSLVCSKCYQFLKDTNKPNRTITESTIKERINVFEKVNKHWTENESEIEACWPCQKHKQNNAFGKCTQSIDMDISIESDFSNCLTSTPVKNRKSFDISTTDADTCMTPNRENNTAFKEILDKPNNAPLNSLEEKLLTKLMRRKIATSDSKQGEVYLKTGGKVNNI